MEDRFSVKGKIALVTGASRGIGQKLAVELGQEGVFVICCSSKKGGSDQTVDMITKAGGKGVSFFADLSKRKEIKSMCNDAISYYGKIDILINNGGTIARYPAIEYPLDEWDRVLEVNLTSAFIISQIIARAMMENGGGKIINIASMLSYSGGITVPAYTASKHGMAGLTKALANEWASHNIQVNAIAPGYIRTDNTQKLQDDPVRNKEIIERIPAGRWGEPEDLAGTAIFLASKASDYLNGTLITVDGGWMSR